MIWTYPVRSGPEGRPIVVQYHDGDTFRLLLDAGCETGLFPWLRVADINTPELRDPGGPEAAAFTAYILANAHEVTVSIRGRSFNRWVANVIVDGRDLSEWLVSSGHATYS